MALSPVIINYNISMADHIMLLSGYRRWRWRADCLTYDRSVAVVYFKMYLLVLNFKFDLNRLPPLLAPLSSHVSCFLEEMLSSGDIAALVYLWNPFTIVACVGLSTSPIENLVVILSLYGACTSKKLKALSGTWVLNVCAYHFYFQAFVESYKF